MKAIPIKSCMDCPFWKETPYPASDSWERPHYWWCTHPDVNENIDAQNVGAINSIDVARRLKKELGVPKLKYIKGYVEWHEERKIEIPLFCPLENTK